MLVSTVPGRSIHLFYLVRRWLSNHRHQPSAMEKSQPDLMIQRERAMKLEQVFEKIGTAPADEGRVQLAAILEILGTRSFGSFLLLAGLVVLLPLIGDIPGVPTLVALVVALVAVQLLMGRDQFWLPQFILKRSVDKGKLHRVLQRAGRYAQRLDRLVKPRLSVFVEDAGRYFIALCSLLIAAMLPPKELVPFSANLAGAALTAFGFALIAKDGLFALIAFCFTLGGAAAALSAIV